jgi:hypothetical protein
MTTLEADSRKLGGFVVKDNLCMDHLKLNCVDKFEFFTVTNDTSKFLGLFSGMMGIIPNTNNPLTNKDPSIISYLREFNYTDHAQVGIRMRPNNNVANSKITFGGYEPGLLYPNSSSEIVWAPRVIV